ncbi:hypothetical protein FHL15_005667 [Xylaria flabelliformis]|uniref:Dystroglycan-type cadherin-like domain-containing protein n=1 Tax=Xylaria flabelliformis TaxID=2512241 RepID=A0A553HZL1_9PEZI|nr:hypothetical protein FHL15_005667 [Xylaria flabelliformis]
MIMTRRQVSPRRSNTTVMKSRWFPSNQLAILLLSSVAFVAGTPTSYFPLNSQLPPVARVSQPFSFVFSPITFTSDLEMSYALGDGSPSWLSLDSASRRLSGTPDEASIPSGETLVGVVITLVASDDTGETATNATLVVSRNPEPKVRIPLEEQIKKLGPYSAPASVLFHPSSEFEFEFDPNTFGVDAAGDGDVQSKTQDVKRNEDKILSVPGPGLNYYAVTGDNAPLPSWIAFDAGKLAFSGRTPPFESLVQPPQKFDFRLVASDVVGFSSVSLGFSIAVGPHELTAEKPIIELNATPGKRLEYTDLPDILKLDKQPLVPENVSSIIADGLPPWLSFDEKSWKISGTPDTVAEPKNVTIAIVDRFWDALNVTLTVNFHTEIFMSDLPDVSTSVGDDFSLDMKKFLSSPMDTEITIETQPDDSWVRFDDSSKVLSGTVPETLSAGSANEIRVTVNAIQTRTKDREVKHLVMHVAENHPTQSPTESPNPAPKNQDESRRDLYWLLTIPVLTVAVAIVMMIFRARRRRDRPRKDFPEVSRPVPGTFVANGFTGASLHDIRRLMDPGPQESSSSQPSGSTSATPSNLRKSRTLSIPNIEIGHVIPHVMTTRSSWFTNRQSRPSPTGTDEVSLLSDTSIGEAVLMTHEELFPNARRATHEEIFPNTRRTLTLENSPAKKIGLAIPTTAEPFSIQPTPELAYTAAGKYDYVSDEEKPSTIGYAARQRLGHQKSKSPIRVQHRFSKLWKEKRFSASSDATTRTSILASGATQEATRASTNVIAKPTVVHIPSRPDEMRQLSRRTNDSILFFGGGSLTKSQRNLKLTKDMSPAAADLSREYPESSTAAKEQYRVRDSNITRDHEARNPLGIVYKDPVQTKRAAKEEPQKGTENENWNTHPIDSSLMSRDRWPVPNAFIGMGGPTDVFRNRSEVPQPALVKTSSKVEPPVTPTDTRKKNGGSARRSGRRSSSISSLTQVQSTHRRSKIRDSREERLRLSRIREQKALDGFRAMVSSQTPSPREEWPPSRSRQLPETPSRASKVLPTDYLSQSRGLKSTLSKRSAKTLHSTKSIRSVAGDDDDDDDAWEDIRPPESVLGEWDGVASDGSFPVYI